MFIKMQDYLFQISEIQSVHKVVKTIYVQLKNTEQKHIVYYANQNEAEKDYQRICEEIAEKTKRRP